MSKTHQMPLTDRRSFVAGATATAALAGAAGHPARAHSSEEVQQIIQDWPAAAKKAANKMIEKYGPPAEATESLLMWHNNGPWKRTVVFKEEVDHQFPMPHKDVMEQFINYRVPPEKFDELAQYDGSVIVERTKGEISARCDKEEANFLALNLANDIVKGNKSVEEARQAYADAIKDMMAGNPPEITQGFTFEVSQADAGDPDQAMIQGG